MLTMSGRGGSSAPKKYYVPFRLRVWDGVQSEPVLDHALDMRGKRVLISFPSGTLGDLVGWVPYAERFRQTYQCHVDCTLAQRLSISSRRSIRSSIFFTPESWQAGPGVSAPPYASWRVGLFF